MNQATDQRSGNARRPYRILIVDDSEFFRTILTDVFQQSGFEVHTAEDGAQALAWMAEHNYELDLLVLDLHMPVKSGFEVLQELRRLPQRSSFYVMAVTSVQRDEDSIIKARRLGADGLIDKSDPPRYFMARVQEVLRSRRK